MKPAAARLLVGLYPRPWRQRYGEEFETLLLEQSDFLKILVDVAFSAAKERMSPTCGQAVPAAATSFRVVMKMPSAILPLALSLAALSVVLAHAAIFGVTHEKDEGTAAHLWQLLIGGALTVMIFFAAKWMPRATKQALAVLIIVSALMLANFAAVYFLT